MTTGGFQHLPWIVGITDDEGADRWFSKKVSLDEHIVYLLSYACWLQGTRVLCGHARCERVWGKVRDPWTSHVWIGRWAERGAEDHGEKGNHRCQWNPSHCFSPLSRRKRFQTHFLTMCLKSPISQWHGQVKDFYWGDEALGEENAESLVNAISDSSYAHPIDTASKIHFMRSSDPVSIAGLIRWWLVNQNVENISLLHMLFVLGLCVSLHVQRRTLDNPSQVGLSLTSKPTTFSDQILCASQSTSE